MSTLWVLYPRASLRLLSEMDHRPDRLLHSTFSYTRTRLPSFLVMGEACLLPSLVLPLLLLWDHGVSTVVFFWGLSELQWVCWLGLSGIPLMKPCLLLPGLTWASVRACFIIFITFFGFLGGWGLGRGLLPATREVDDIFIVLA